MISYPYFKKLLCELIFDRVYFGIERNCFTARVYLNGRLLKVFGVRKKDCSESLVKDFGFDTMKRYYFDYIPELPFDNETSSIK